MKCIKSIAKKTVVFMLVFSTACSLLACSNEKDGKKGSRSEKNAKETEDIEEDEAEYDIEEYSAKDFKKILKNEADIDKDDIYEYETDDYSTVSYYTDDYSFYFSEFEDEEEAYKAFRTMYHEYEDMKEDDSYDGTLEGFKSKSKGYILCNGSFDDDGYDYDAYGGVYFTGNMLCRIWCDSLKEKKTEKIDDILDALGFPKP